jgi:predicted phosphodiesterase
MTMTEFKKVGIFSDIHSNLHALKAVLDAFKEEGVDHIFCCGDIIGYGAFPNECCDLLKKNNCPVTAGNHDHAVLGMTDISYFNEVAKKAVMWTRDVLSKENKEYIKSLPLTYSESDILCVHSSPDSPEEWNYILTMGEARVNFNHFTEQFCFIGHSHQPFIIINHNGDLVCPETPEIEFVEDRRYLINVGSVGQPRDRNPNACYVILDFENKKVEIKRTPYDIKAAQDAIINEGLSRELAERLAYGW